MKFFSSKHRYHCIRTHHRNWAYDFDQGNEMVTSNYIKGRGGHAYTVVYDEIAEGEDGRGVNI